MRFGFGKEVEAVLAANTPKLQSVVPAEAEALLEELTVFGTPAEARGRLERWYAAGVDYPGLLLPPSLTPAQVEFTLDAFARCWRRPPPSGPEESAMEQGAA